MVVTGCALARAVGTSEGRARMFLRIHQTETPKEARARLRFPKLEQAWTRLEAQGVPLTSTRLAQEARVGKRAAREFLAARGGERHGTA